MPSVDPSRMKTDQAPAAQACSALYAVRAHLLTQKQAVDAEIRAYPPPIAACDAQFNHLLAQRAGLFRALRRLDALAARTLRPAEMARALDAFVASCPFVDEEMAERIRANPG